MQFFECFLLNSMKNEENNAIFWMFFVECNEKWRKCKEIMQFLDFFLLNAMKNEENKGNNAIFLCSLLNVMKHEENKENNAIFWMFLVECDEKWRK